jgi:DNA-binding Lrp family transcriptional regulator
MAHLGFENAIPAAQATLADELGIAQPNVARAVKRLEQAGFIARAKDSNNPRRMSYRLNPSLIPMRQQRRHWCSQPGARVPPRWPTCHIHRF